MANEAPADHFQVPRILSHRVGIVLLGIQLRLVDTFVLNEKSTQFLAQRIQQIKGKSSAGELTTLVSAQGPVPFDPALNRVFVRFRDPAAIERGATSVAARTP